MAPVFFKQCVFAGCLPFPLPDPPALLQVQRLAQLLSSSAVLSKLCNLAKPLFSSLVSGVDDNSLQLIRTG